MAIGAPIKSLGDWHTPDVETVLELCGVTSAGSANLCALDDARVMSALAYADKVELGPTATSSMQALRNAGSPAVESVNRAWSDIERRTMRYRLQRELALDEMNRVVSSLPVPALLLKGLALERFGYCPSARLSLDLDLLIGRDEYEVCKRALASLGYSVIPIYEERVQRARGKDVAFSRIDDAGLPWAVELHWRFTEPGLHAPSPADVWSRSIMAFDRIRCPGPEDMLVLLVLNFRKHRMSGLKTLCDIHRLISSTDSLNWQLVTWLSRESGFSGLLDHTLSLCNRLFSTQIPGWRIHQPAWRTPQMRLLQRLSTAQLAILGSDGNPALGLLPFVSLDRPSTIAHLVVKRLAESPVEASYRVAGTESAPAFHSRRSYLKSTFGHGLRAFSYLFSRSRRSVLSRGSARRQHSRNPFTAPQS